MAEFRTGELVKDSGSFGFIAQDGVDENMFVLPKSCQVFGGVLPPIGTRVVFTVVVDEKTGRPRAEDVQPEDQSMMQLAIRGEELQGGYEELLVGTIIKVSGSFGFIEQEAGGENMFVIPQSCEAWGRQLPPIGTRVHYNVTTDEKTGRPRAGLVLPADSGVGSAPPSRQPQQRQPMQQRQPPMQQRQPPMQQRQPMQREAPRYVDAETAAIEQLEQELMQTMPDDYAAGGDAAFATGVVIKNTGVFGFIQQDAGGDNMFMMPGSCPALNNEMPQVGAHVQYQVVTDDKTGRPRAHDLQVVGGRSQPVAAQRYQRPPVQAQRVAPMVHQQVHQPVIGMRSPAGTPRTLPPRSLAPAAGSVGSRIAARMVAPAVGRPMTVGGGGAVSSRGGCSGGGGGHHAGGMHTGTILAIQGAFGFIEQDVGGDNMFVLPKTCQYFGGEIPPIGTRVKYQVVVDQKTGRPRAENVVPEHEPDPALEFSSGIVIKSTAGFGFVQQDSGGDNMFLIPSTCHAWGNNIPPEGTRLLYTIATDEKTGRPRCDVVEPEGGAAPVPVVCKGGKGGGKKGGGKHVPPPKGGGKGFGQVCGKGYGKAPAARAHAPAGLPY